MNKISNETSEWLKSITQQVLKSVRFVADYFVLQFGDFRLSVFAPTLIESGQASVRSDAPEFSEYLGEQIGSSVVEVSINRESCRLLLSSGASVLISLRQNDYPGPEALTLRGPGNELLVI